MKSIGFTLSILLSLFSIDSAFSAQIVPNDIGKEKVGVVSASDAATLDELLTKLSSQADKQGASSFKILSTTGNNKMHGVAEIYK
ncbi:MAG: multiple stress resistance protein BhsA [Azospira oryzae]|nr:MAG: multiple stress resistance protein BhsA [Azospira oryzae]